jgi:hypothetical protein
MPPVHPKESSSTTDEHGYEVVAASQRFTRKVSKPQAPKSVFIRVHPWLMILRLFPTAVIGFIATLLLKRRTQDEERTAFRLLT